MQGTQGTSARGHARNEDSGHEGTQDMMARRARRARDLVGSFI